MTEEGYLAEQLSSQNFSALTHLELLQKDTSNTIVKALTTSAKNDESPSQEILPRLETLGLRSSSTDDGNLSRMVLSRYRRTKGTFKHIRLGAKGNEESHVIDREVFRRLEKEGFTFQWHLAWPDI